MKDLRLKLGMTQGEFASHLGVSRNYIALIETGRRNTPVTLLQRAQALVDKKEAEESNKMAPSVSTTNENTEVKYWKDRALAAEDVLGRIRSALDAVSGYRPPPQE